MSQLAPKEGGIVARWVAEGAWLGRVPFAPGTFGSLLGIPLHLVLCSFSSSLYWLALLGCTALGVWAAEHRSRQLGDPDPSSVVIDEVVGTSIAFGLISHPGCGVTDGLSWQGQTLAFVCAFLLFRLFDITKPGIIFEVQALEPKGVGIMADDVLAGFAAGAVASACIFLVRLSV